MMTGSRYPKVYRHIQLWSKFTDLAKNKQGPAVFLSLEGETQEAVLQLAENVINSDSGVKHIIERLDSIYKKDELLKKYKALEAFETYKPASNTSMQEFLNEFTRRYNKTKSFGTTMSDDILAYRLLKSANLSEQHEQLAKATISDLKLGTMKDQVKKIFGDLSCILPTSSSDGVIKTEQVNHLQEDCSSDQGLYFSYNQARGAPRGRCCGLGHPQSSFSSRVKPKQGKNLADERGIQQFVQFANPLTTNSRPS